MLPNLAILLLKKFLLNQKIHNIIIFLFPYEICLWIVIWKVISKLYICFNTDKY